MESDINQFKDILIASSQGTEYSEVIKEWDVGFITESPNKCICGQDIMENCHINNKLNGNELVVGNTCINKFMNINMKSCFTGAKNVKKKKNPTKQYIEYCLNKKMINEWEAKFMLDMRNKRRFTKKQLQLRDLLCLRMELK